MKQIKKAEIVQSDNLIEHAKTELEVLKDVRGSSFLLTVHYAFQTATKLHLILDYISRGDLLSLLKERDHFSESHVRFWGAELILALGSLHQKGIIHRDLKLANILLSTSGHVVLSDFGLSKRFHPDEKRYRAHSPCGTTKHKAPEVLEEDYTFTADWWSLGTVFYELLTGTSAFKQAGDNIEHVIKRIMRAQPHIPHHLSPECQQLLQRLLARHPQERLGHGGAGEVKKHPFFKSLDFSAVAKGEIQPPPPLGPTPDKMKKIDFTSGVSDEDELEAAFEDWNKIFQDYSYISPDHVQFFELYEVDYTQRVLEDGLFSIIRKCRRIESGQEYNVKILSRCTNSTRQVELLQLLQNHPNIVHVHQVLQDQLHTYIVMELLTGSDLFSRILNEGRLTESRARKIMNKLVSAVSFMHKHHVVHRDLKPENLLFENDSESAEIKVVDFNFGGLRWSHDSLTSTFIRGYNGETLTTIVQVYDEYSDIWSLGVILFTMLSGRQPFQTLGRDVGMEFVMQRTVEAYSVDSTEWKSVSAEAKDLVRGLLTVDPRMRMSMSDLRSEKWLFKTETEVLPRTSPILSQSPVELSAQGEGMHPPPSSKRQCASDL